MLPIQFTWVRELNSDCFGARDSRVQLGMARVKSSSSKVAPEFGANFGAASARNNWPPVCLAQAANQASRWLGSSLERPPPVEPFRAAAEAAK